MWKKVSVLTDLKQMICSFVCVWVFYTCVCLKRRCVLWVCDVESLLSLCGCPEMMKCPLGLLNSNCFSLWMCTFDVILPLRISKATSTVWPKWPQNKQTLVYTQILQTMAGDVITGGTGKGLWLAVKQWPQFELSIHTGTRVLHRATLFTSVAVGIKDTVDQLHSEKHSLLHLVYYKEVCGHSTQSALRWRLWPTMYNRRSDVCHFSITTFKSNSASNLGTSEYDSVNRITLTV